MSPQSIFDIAGPVMIGPSSSHTAGAVKLGQIARALFNATPDKVTFVLHGSFATVYKGHATDKALMGGTLKFKTSDPKIRDSLKIAKEKGIKYKVTTDNLGIGYHPNTVKIILEKKGKRKMEIIGSSIGGGNVEIKKIDEFDVDFHGVAGKHFTLVISYKDKPGVLAKVTNFVAKKKINIADLQTMRLSQGGKSLMILSLDSAMDLNSVKKLQKDKNIYFVRALTKII